MDMNMTEKILRAHLVEGNCVPGEEIAITIDQTLTQDSTGTMAYLQFEALEIPRVKTQRSVAYIDHNTLQTGFENADDHQYLQSVAYKHGVYCSKPGNGICHQVNLERFSIPGQTLLGSDSHTPTAGGIGMLAIGAGGLDVALAMAGSPYYLRYPQVINVRLSGKLSFGVSAKDIILEVLRRLSVKGGVGKVIEYTGEGIESLSVPERATITNMGAELGATTSLFPSDHVTKAFLAAQGREEDFVPLLPDNNALYHQTLDIDLSALVPMVAKPHMPDNVATVTQVGPIKINQVCIGSCTNSSYLDMMRVAAILKGKTVHPDVSLIIAPGSKQVLTMLAQNGALADMIAAGARITESACGFCIGMGQSPSTDAVSLRTSNRNFYGRSGTVSAQVYLCGVEVAAYSALTGVLSDPRELSVSLDIAMPVRFSTLDNLIIPPCQPGEEADQQVIRGPNIQPFPLGHSLPERLEGDVLLKMEDNITTDHIMPSSSKLLPYRSNIPYLSDYCLTPVDPTFPARAKEKKGGFLVAGQNYGQGSSREHAALVPLYLGVKGVLALSFARIHQDNLINNGILPLVFAKEEDYQGISMDDQLTFPAIRQEIIDESPFITCRNESQNLSYQLILQVSPRQKKMLLAGGALKAMTQ
ncbi:MAG: aconitate hydratase [Clostridiales bacterium]|nr:aconitate hydratase [Clostridiales bacterium]